MRVAFRRPEVLLAGLVAVLLFGCSARRHDAAAISAYSEIIVSEMVYDARGVPAPGEAQMTRPSRPGDHFTAVTLAAGRPLASCDIAVVSEHADFRKPFQVIYEWTGKGFEVGMEATAALAQGLRGNYAGSDAFAALAFVFTPVALGGVTGFVIGVGDGVVQTAVELRKFAVSANEQVLTCTEYDYDLRGRIVRMRMLAPDRKQELVRTTFEYDGFGKEPVRTSVESYVEGRRREIR